MSLSTFFWSEQYACAKFHSNTCKNCICTYRISIHKLNYITYTKEHWLLIDFMEIMECYN